MGTPMEGGEGVHAELMREQGKSSVASVDMRCVWRTCWFFLWCPFPWEWRPAMGSSLCSLLWCRWCGEAQEREKCQSCGVMPFLYRAHIRGTSPNTQPHSVVSIGAVSFYPLGRRGKANSPACRTFGFMTSTCPAPGRRWGSQGHLPSH